MKTPLLRARRLFARGLAVAGEGSVWSLDLTGRYFVISFNVLRYLA
jgi:hypothetical protein